MYDFNNITKLKVGGKRGRPRTRPKSLNYSFDPMIGKKKWEGAIKGFQRQRKKITERI